MALYPPTRLDIPELMDDVHSDTVLLERTLAQFPRINRLVSRNRTVLRREILQDMEERIARNEVPRTHRFTVLDCGAGACDLAVWLLDEAERRGITVEVTALDADPRVVAYARRTVQRSGIIIRQGSALDLPAVPEWDYIMANHFLHHLTDEEVAQFLTGAPKAARYRVVVNDLLRSWVWLALYRIFAAVALRESFARYDGAVSILKGFRPGELRTHLAPHQHLDRDRESRVFRMFPGRVVVMVLNNPNGAGTVDE